jgi:hypothetical protein
MENPSQLFWKAWKNTYKPSGLRLGQAFCNHFGVNPKSENGQQLFYEQNEHIAENYINEFFRDW